ncbi:MAG: hypothetical protein R6U19_01450, partial [Bacteroidales bacterium]
GRLYYSFTKAGRIDLSSSQYFDEAVQIEKGKAEINILNKLSDLGGGFDWQERGNNELRYRILNQNDRILYEGRLIVQGQGSFTLGPTIVEGPFISRLTYNKVVISFRTRKPATCNIAVNGRILRGKQESRQHNILADGLEADSTYSYHLLCGDYTFSSSFRTPPAPGSGEEFVFAFASNSVAEKGGGEKDIFGVNAHILKRAGALANSRDVDFWQFTGDLAKGYTENTDHAGLQYASWKRAMSSFAHKRPVFVGMGGSEAVSMRFRRATGEHLHVDRFPFDKKSSEAVFSRQFEHFKNGPPAEFGALYYVFEQDTSETAGMEADKAREADAVSGSTPPPGAVESYCTGKEFGTESVFPTYQDNVYSYRWDNIGMIVMNSAYWHAFKSDYIPLSSGNPLGFIMDNQLRWLAFTLKQMENDPKIDHVLVSLYSQLFPVDHQQNKGMWYGGDNQVRPYINGKPHEKGIIERRDAILDMMVNKSTKTVAVLCSQSRGYQRLLINDSLQRYPEDYNKPKLKLDREIWQISSGLSGDSYSRGEMRPWSAHQKAYSNQSNMVFLYVEGEDIRLEVVNPETLERIEEFKF